MDFPSFLVVNFIEPPVLALILLWANQLAISVIVAGLAAEMAAPDDPRPYLWAIPIVVVPILTLPVFLWAVRRLRLRRGYDDHRGRWIRRRAYGVAVATVVLLVVVEAVLIALLFGVAPAIRAIGAPRPQGYF